MKRTLTTRLGLAALSTIALLIGIGVGHAAIAPALASMRDKPTHEAGLIALAQARRLADDDSWGTIALARIYYLAGEQATAEAMIDPYLRKPGRGDLQRIGELYAEAGQADRADRLFQQAIAAAPKDDWGQMEMATWYLRLGRRTQGEALFGNALARSPKRFEHYLRAGEGYLNVPQSP